LKRFLSDGGMSGISAADHLLGDIELLLLNKEKGTLK
jgi:hypothetical protein